MNRSISPQWVHGRYCTSILIASVRFKSLLRHRHRADQRLMATWVARSTSSQGPHPGTRSMSLADLPSRRHHPLRFRGGPRRRRAHALSRFAPQVSPLEDRCLLTSALLGPETLVNATLAGEQQFATDGGRSIDVTSSGTVIAVWSSTGA